MTDDEKILWAHQERVGRFGGRIGRPGADKVWKELESSNLGSKKILLTTSAVLDLPPVVTLAEMKLKAPIEVDVTFSYFNELYIPFPSPDPPVITPPPENEGALPGDGFVRITWGIPGAPQMVVECDGALGWRFPFVASYLRVEYVPIDVGAPPSTHIPGGQERNLGLSAMIAPASGAPCQPLQKTMFFPVLIASGQVRWAVIPRRAINFRASVFHQVGAGPANYEIFVNSTNVFPGGFLESFLSNTIVAEWPQWVTRLNKMPLHPAARFMSWGNPIGSAPLNNAVIVCELAL